MACCRPLQPSSCSPAVCCAAQQRCPHLALTCRMLCHLQVSSAALALFDFGQQEAAKRGLLLVDTKYEFGKDDKGNIMLIDEVCVGEEVRLIGRVCVC